jgi:hypothetical protein
MASYRTTKTYNTEPLTVQLHFPKSLTEKQRNWIMVTLKLIIAVEAKRLTKGVHAVKL